MASPTKTYWQCQRCTNCCKWPGQVKLTDGDIDRAAELLETTEHEFIERWTQHRPDRQGLALLNKENGECIFLEGRDCRIQNAKPAQCSGFPNTWSFPGWRDVCEAIPVMITASNLQNS